MADDHIPRKRKKYHRLTPSQREEIARRYAAGEGDTPLCREFGVTEGTAHHLAMRRGFIITPHTNRGGVQRSVNHNAFSEMTPEVAYWIGMLITDGFVTDKGSVNLGLAAEDAGHIEKFKTFLSAEHKIYITRNRGTFNGYEKQDFHRLSVLSRKMCADLAKFGVVPRKTGKEKSCEEMAYNSDFWRGVIDGDGTVSIKGRASYPDGYPMIRLCGTSEVFLSQFIEFCRTICPVQVNVSKSSEVMGVQIQGRAATKIVTALYQNCSVALDRKLKIANHIMILIPEWVKLA